MSENANPQSENSSTKSSDPAYKWIKIGLLVSVLILLVSWGMYVWKVGSSLSSDSSDWSDFGGFLGGMGSAIGPTLTVAGLLFVWWQGKQGDIQNAKKIDVMADSVQELVNQTVLMRSHLTELENHGKTYRDQLHELAKQSKSLSLNAHNSEQLVMETQKQLAFLELRNFQEQYQLAITNCRNAIFDKPAILQGKTVLEFIDSFRPEEQTLTSVKYFMLNGLHKFVWNAYRAYDLALKLKELDNSESLSIVNVSFDLISISTKVPCLLATFSEIDYLAHAFPNASSGFRSMSDDRVPR